MNETTREKISSIINKTIDDLRDDPEFDEDMLVEVAFDRLSKTEIDWLGHEWLRIPPS